MRVPGSESPRCRFLVLRYLGESGGDNGVRVEALVATISGEKRYYAYFGSPGVVIVAVR